jgi:hypothetical protein
MKPSIHLWSYLAYFISEWEKFQIKVVEEIKTHICVQYLVFRKLCRLWYNVEKYWRCVWEYVFDEWSAYGNSSWSVKLLHTAARNLFYYRLGEMVNDVALKPGKLTYYQ